MEKHHIKWQSKTVHENWMGLAQREPTEELRIEDGGQSIDEVESSNPECSCGKQFSNTDEAREHLHDVAERWEE